MNARRMTAIVLMMVLAIPTAAVADEPDADITDRQQTLNEQGVEAIDAGDYERAIEVYEASLELGELNIIHANLGRAFQLAGQCEEADEQFRKALQAPSVEQPPPEMIEEAIENYRDTMDDECPGTVELDCDPADMEVYIDGDGPEQCHPDPREMMPGDYGFRGEVDEQSVEESVTVEALQHHRVSLHLELDETAPDVAAGDIAPPEEMDDAGGSRAWMWLGFSGAAIAGGVAFDNIPSQARNYEINPINFVPVGLYAAGAGLAFLGIRALRR